MTKQTICDLCGEELQGGYHFKVRRSFNPMTYIHAFYGGKETDCGDFDMCEKCFEKIKQD
jgi:hypothetical protein